MGAPTERAVRVETCIQPSSSEMSSIGRLRYRVYIEEMGKHYSDADHSGQALLDELDPVSTHFLVHDPSGCLVAALRWTALSVIGTPRLASEGLEAVASNPHLIGSSSLSSRLVLDRRVRGTLRQLPAMIEAIYRHGSTRGTLLNFLHCQPRLAPMFTSIGFRPIGQGFVFEPTGRTHVRLCLQTDAIGPLEAVGSPLASCCRELFGPCESPASDSLLAWASRAMGSDVVVPGGIGR